MLAATLQVGAEKMNPEAPGSPSPAVRSFDDFIACPVPDLSGHIVLLGMPVDLVDFVAPLRSRHLTHQRPVVVVSPRTPTQRS